MILEPILILSFLLCVLVTAGMVEYFLHQRTIRMIPLRVHVNGSRGKSSVVRLIAAGLRGGGKRAFAKTTGTLPRIIGDNNSEWAIKRHGGASIGEQIRIIRKLAKKQPEIYVVECMAVKPEYQHLTEHQMIHATHGVITNARMDHLDEMGPTYDDVVNSLLNTRPRNGKLYFGDHSLEETHRSAGHHERDLSEWIERFKYQEHEENINLALDVCNDLGVDDETALRGMINAHPDPGALQVLHIENDGNMICFANGFAANDPGSTKQVWDLVRRRNSLPDYFVILLNSRSDRFFRSKQLASMIGREFSPNAVFLMGQRTNILKKIIVKNGFSKKQITDFGEKSANAIILKLMDSLKGKDVTVFSIGNIGLQGGAVVEILDDLSKEFA
ncbi:MAG: poly-gamma-glutamate synthase PgsB [Candidatus Marinimicrobia bacterium]|nr:poly-gamma-glutamate synthase PgsB [Candidatus Neomarinimicrobiota bacterium]